MKKKLKTPRPSIDLHGMSVQDAYEYVLDSLDHYEQKGSTEVEVITGKSGAIRREFPEWMTNNSLTFQVSSHDGSFVVHLK